MIGSSTGILVVVSYTVSCRTTGRSNPDQSFHRFKHRLSRDDNIHLSTNHM
jgi:hypothetical protein